MGDTKSAAIAVSLWIIGVIFGGGFVYGTFTSHDQNVDLRLSQLEGSCIRHQTDINTQGREISKTNSKIISLSDFNEKIISMLREVAHTNKQIAVSNSELSIAIARLEERQKGSDYIIQSLTNKIEGLHDTVE